MAPGEESSMLDLPGREEAQTMDKRYVIAGLAAVGITALARRGASHCGSMDFGKMIERMPDDAPPKWMFRNVSAIRQNTDRILELLEAEHRPAASTPTEAVPI
jgi:hypothetical protein